MKKEIKVGNVLIGGNNPIIIQSMTNTKTANTKDTIAQINALALRGAQIVRLAITNMSDAEAIREIKQKTSIPLVADVHFDYRLALKAVEAGIDKLRINPGNINNKEHLKLLINACKEKQIPIRIGINGGSLDAKYQSITAENLVASAKEHVKRLEENDFFDICISIKTSDINTTIEANRLANKLFSYPLHIGLTEAGTLMGGSIRSSYALGVLLSENIGSTIRISLTGDPLQEVDVAKEILKMFGKVDEPTLISCPTCGRTNYDMLAITNEIEAFIKTIKAPLKIAIMGCAVNGPGEASEADIGIAGGRNSAVLFKKGKIIKKLAEDEIISTLKEEIKNLEREYIK